MPNNPNFQREFEPVQYIPPQSRLLTHPRTTIAEGMLLFAGYVLGIVAAVFGLLWIIRTTLG
jgi:hypothetical protein